MGKVSSESNQIFLSVASVAERYAVSQNSIWRFVREGNFPKPKKLGLRSTRWRLADLESWEAQL